MNALSRRGIVTPLINAATKLKPILFAVALVTSSILSNLSTADPLRKGKTVLVSTDPNGDSADGGHPSVSADGRYVAFESGNQLTPDDTDGNLDVYRKDMATGDIKLVSVDALGIPAGVCYRNPSMSGDGTKIAYFVSYVNDLTLGCYVDLVLLKDLSIGQTKWILPPSSGYVSDVFQLSRDGRYVVTDRENGDSYHDTAVIDVSNGSVVWTSPFICGGCLGREGGLSISDNGRFVTFDSERQHNSPYSQDNDGFWDVYLHDRDFDGNGVYDEVGVTKVRTSLVGILPDGSSPQTLYGAISGDGKWVAFEVTFESGIINLYLRNLTTGVTELASSGGTTDLMSLSTSGRFLTFATVLMQIPNDLNPRPDIYLWDRELRKLTLISFRPDGSQVAEYASHPSISADGRYVAFGGGLINGAVYRRDLNTPCEVICAEDSVPPVPPSPRFHQSHPSHLFLFYP
ncbi:MAG: hypothetical protein ABIS18_00580 [Actinomycetota bacterium]